MNIYMTIHQWGKGVAKNGVVREQIRKTSWTNQKITQSKQRNLHLIKAIYNQIPPKFRNRIDQDQFVKDYPQMG